LLFSSFIALSMAADSNRSITSCHCHRAFHPLLEFADIAWPWKLKHGCYALLIELDLATRKSMSK
jgi:hypothetical protein